tara:strand:+ start:1759 stop:2151 length:393 start_codon:yes stop_codon:yes gene_type:complete
MSEITIAGNIGQAPELRFSQKGTANIMFSVAVTTGRDTTKATHWFDVKCFDTLAERMAELPKGERVLIKGRMKEDEWTNKEGKTTKKLRLYADDAGPSWRWEPRGSRSDTVQEEAVATVQKGFEVGEEPF